MLDHKDIHETSTVKSFYPLSTSPKKAAAMTAADTLGRPWPSFSFFFLQVLTREPGNKFLDVLGAGNIKKKHPLETQMLASYVQTNPIYGL